MVRKERSFYLVIISYTPPSGMVVPLANKPYSITNKSDIDNLYIMHYIYVIHR